MPDNRDFNQKKSSSKHPIHLSRLLQASDRLWSKGTWNSQYTPVRTQCSVLYSIFRDPGPPHTLKGSSCSTPLKRQL